MAAHLLYTSLLESVQKFTTIRKTNKKGNVETSLLKYHIHCFLDTTKSFLANLKLKLTSSVDYMAKKLTNTENQILFSGTSYCLFLSRCVFDNVITGRFFCYFRCLDNLFFLLLKICTLGFKEGLYSQNFSRSIYWPSREIYKISIAMIIN